MVCVELWSDGGDAARSDGEVEELLDAVEVVERENVAGTSLLCGGSLLSVTPSSIWTVAGGSRRFQWRKVEMHLVNAVRIDVAHSATRTSANSSTASAEGNATMTARPKSRRAEVATEVARDLEAVRLVRSAVGECVRRRRATSGRTAMLSGTSAGPCGCTRHGTLTRASCT